MRGGRQQELRFSARDGTPVRGGKRPGAGRKPNGRRAGVSHLRRPELSHRHPVLVTLRIVPEIGRLRRRDAYRAVRQALATSLSRQRGHLRICHISIEGNHLHLLVEADDKRALSRGMQGFAISCARHLNQTLTPSGAEPRKGRVFADRYHAAILDGPRRVRHALSYVLNNWRRHREDLGSRERLDPYSSGAAFGGWSDGPRLVRIGPRDELLPVWYPQTWLLSQGWRRGGEISPWERPGPD